MPLTSNTLLTPFLTGPGGTDSEAPSTMSDIPNRTTRLHLPGSSLQVPGIEAILEYGDVENVVNDRIHGALRINDRTNADQIHITEISGLQDDPDGRDTRSTLADIHGEAAGRMLYGGRTIGLTGRVQANNVARMRDLWRRMRSNFGTAERDLLIHPPYELPIQRNEVLDPSFVDLTSWGTPTTSSGTIALTSTTEGLRGAGSLAMTGATGAGSMQVWALATEGPDSITNAPGNVLFEPWLGKDVWVFARVKVASATAPVSSITMGPREWHDVVPGVSAVGVAPTSFATRSSPTTGTWYDLSIRVGADAVKANTFYVTPQVTLNYTGAGAATLLIADVTLIFLDPEDPTPTSPFNGDMIGYVWSGSRTKSASLGPVYAVNIAPDPRFEDFAEPTHLLNSWTNYATTGLTIDQAPLMSRRWTGSSVERSVYYKVSKAADTTSRTMGIKANYGTEPPAVRQGRVYRFSAKVNVVQKPATGSLTLGLLWLAHDGTTVLATNTSSTPFTVGENTESMAVNAPANAFTVVPFVADVGVTTASSILEMYVSDVCVVDITDWDPGDFYGVGDKTEESDIYRRIPRPFLIRGVRKTSDMKAPEQQTNLQYRRPFTMSLRASDPRIYCLDQRNKSARLSGAPKFVATQSEVFDLGYQGSGVSLQTPFGYTSEGTSVSTVLSGIPFWSRNLALLSRLEPNNGVAISYQDNATGGVIPPPASDQIARYYRSAEGYTYTEPRIVAGCSPISFTYDFVLRGVTYLGRGWYNTGTGIYANSMNVLIKRVNSTTWLELRWTSADSSIPKSDGSPQGGPSSFELWCSHNTGGTLATTRLANWNVYWAQGAERLLWDPNTNPRWLSVELKDNVVTWWLWKSYPNRYSANLSDLLYTHSYTIPSGLQSVIGSSVAGSPGWAMYVPIAGADENAWNTMAANPPFLHYFEASDANVFPAKIPINVIGDIDTPPVITLKGDLVDPVITMEGTDDDGRQVSSHARFIGTIPNEIPVTIDVGTGVIADPNGANKYSMLQPGSNFLNLQPGLNIMEVQAANWDATAIDHVEVSWRDALS